MTDPDKMEFLTVHETAELLRTSPAAIYQWRRRRQGPPGCLIGARLVFRREDVVRWVGERVDRDQRTRSSRPPSWPTERQT